MHTTPDDMVTTTGLQQLGSRNATMEECNKLNDQMDLEDGNQEEEWRTLFVIDSDDEDEEGLDSLAIEEDYPEEEPIVPSENQRAETATNNFCATCRLLRNEFRLFLVMALLTASLTAHRFIASSSPHRLATAQSNELLTEIIDLDTISETDAPPPPPPKPAWLDFEMEPYHGPPSLEETVDKCAQQPGLCYSYVCRGSGFGGQTMTFLSDIVYMRHVYNRTVIILDESHYRKYATANDVGFMLAYFTPRMAVLDKKSDVSLLDPIVPGDGIYVNSRGNHHQFDADSHLAVGRHPGQHNQLLRYYSSKHNRSMDDLYQDLVPVVCPNMQFNNQSWTRIQELRHEFSFPNYLELPPHAPVVNVTTGVNETTRVGSISFHVRRTDKVATGKSPIFPVSEYLAKARMIQERDNIQLTHCFVATDDYMVTYEMRNALERNPKNDSLCTYLHFTPGNGHSHMRQSEDGALVFLMELSILIETTYFVGTYNSNVGDLVAVLRACPNLPHDGTQHYAESYGVDSDRWYYDPGKLPPWERNP